MLFYLDALTDLTGFRGLHIMFVSLVVLAIVNNVKVCCRLASGLRSHV